MKCFECLLTFLLFINLIVLAFVECKISDKRLCVDELCSVPVSEAKTVVNYNSDDNRKLSFKSGQDAIIYSKSAGDRPDLWGAEINGKRGYVSKDFVKETKMLKKKPEITVPTEEALNKKPGITVPTEEALNKKPGITVPTEEALNKKPGITVPTEEAEVLNTVNETLPVIENLQNQVKGMYNNLKGSFSLTGVSADSVPSDIKPEHTQPYQVIDGTTILTELSDSSTTQSVPEFSDTSSETPPLNSDVGTKRETEDSVTKTKEETIVPNVAEDNTSNQGSKPIEDVKSEEKKKETLDVEDKKKQAQKPTGYFGFFGAEESNESENDEDDIDDEEYDEIEDNEDENNIENQSPVLEMSPTSGLNDSILESGSLQIDKKINDTVDSTSTSETPNTIADSQPASENEEENIKNQVKDSQILKTEDSKLKEVEQSGVDTENTQQNNTVVPSINNTKVEESDASASLKTESVSTSQEPTESVPLANDDKKYTLNTTETVQASVEDNSKTENITEEIKQTITTSDGTTKAIAEEIKQTITTSGGTSEAIVEEIKQTITTSDGTTKAIAEEIKQTITTSDGTSEAMAEERKQTITTSDGASEAITEEIKQTIPTADNKTEDIAEEMKETIPTSDNKTETIAEEIKTIPISDNKTETIAEEIKTIPTSVNKTETIAEEIKTIPTLDSTTEVKAEAMKQTIRTSDLPTDEANVNATSAPSPESSNLANIDVIPNYTPTTSNEPTAATSVIADSYDSSVSIEQTTETSVSTVDDTNVYGSAPLSLPAELPKPTTDPQVETVTDPVPSLDSPDTERSEDAPLDTKQVPTSEVYSTLDTNISQGEESIEEISTPSVIENDGFPGVVEEVNKDAVNIVSEDSIVITTEDTGFFSWFSSLFSGSDVPTNQVEEVSDVVTSQPEEPIEQLWNHPNSVEDSAAGSCSIPGLGEDSCTKIDPVRKPEVWTSSESSDGDFVMMSAVGVLEKVPIELTLLLVVTAVAVLVFTLGYYYIEAHKRDGLLVARINALERDLLVKKKENAILEDACTNAQFEVKGRDSDLSEVKETNEELLSELEELKAVRMELEEQVTTLEKELESVTESGLEMHRLLSESLSTQDGSQVLLQTVESLREKLDKQDSQIVLLNRSLGEKNEEIEMLQNQLSTSDEACKTLNEKLNTLRREKEEEELEIKEKHRALMVQLEEAVETKALEESRMSMEMSKLRITLEEVQHKLIEREAEVEAMKESVRQLRSADHEERLQELYDVAAVSAKLSTVTTERDEFREKFIEEEGARKLLEDHVRVISREVAELKENFEAAEKEKIEALTKLKVLSNYFKEKESELQKELGTQESMWLQKQGDDHTIYEQMRSLREENDKFNGESVITLREVEMDTNHKKVSMINGNISPKGQPKGLQNESLKKEICEQESSFKIQLANVEQRAHENWVASRQAERRLKEVQQEATQLRNRLTLSEKNAVNHEDPKQKINETNGDPSSPPPSLMFSPTTSPPFMMYHGMGSIPPGDFIPPPPLISPFSPDSRPPPLGRISSPPLDPRFSPPPPTIPFSPYDYSYGHRSPSPPPPLPHRTVHKPQPREAGREPKDLTLPPPGLGLLFEPPPPYLCSPLRYSNCTEDTVTPNYSLESTDKPSRRSKR